ncbi:hypothetical protein [Streptomyces zhihengii]
MLNQEMGTYDETVDDAVAASVGRSRMADGRRINLTVEALAEAVGAGGGDITWSVVGPTRANGGS